MNFTQDEQNHTLLYLGYDQVETHIAGKKLKQLISVIIKSCLKGERQTEL